jgi:hypothetical protein
LASRARIIPAAALAAACVAALAAPALATTAEPPAFEAAVERTYTDTWDADQGIAVDRKHFYAIDNAEITKHDRETGEPILQFAGAEGGPIEHLDSGMVLNGKLYTAHSNYPEWPMESSIEVFDTKTLEHVQTHSFGIYRGSLTWLDHHDGSWWAAFANYNRVMDGMDEPYGQTYNTQVVRMNDDFQVLESYTIPKAILDKFELMSNSGGSWGPDGRLYLTGHDLAETYVMELPRAGAELEWVATIALPGIEGQGIAWDRSDKKSPTLWGISRANDQVHEFTLPLDEVASPSDPQWEILGPDNFRR